MRRYNDPVDVRRGRVRDGVDDEGPEQFLWRGRLWQVRAILAHWVETGSWWDSADVRSVTGSDDPADDAADDAGGEGGAGAAGGRGATDLLGERELWRVEARRGPVDGGGVFDLAFDWGRGQWQLVGCQD